MMLLVLDTSFLVRELLRRAGREHVIDDRLDLFPPEPTCSQRDPAGGPVVATALALSADIWTNEKDFLAARIATRTEMLQAWLDRS